MSDIQHHQIRDWLVEIQDPDPELRRAATAKLQKVGSERLFPLLKTFLDDSNEELRCLIAETMFRVDQKASVSLLLPLLDDSAWAVRVQVCGILHDAGAKEAVEPLSHIMRTDSHPMVRNTAAYALGGIGDPNAIPTLIEVLDHDHEQDELGHTASSCAETALDDILNTNHTRIKLDGELCTLQPNRRDPAVLKTQAMKLYRGLKEYDPQADLE